MIFIILFLKYKSFSFLVFFDLFQTYMNIFFLWNIPLIIFNLILYTIIFLRLIFYYFPKISISIIINFFRELFIFWKIDIFTSLIFKFRFICIRLFFNPFKVNIFVFGRFFLRYFDRIFTFKGVNPFLIIRHIVR